MTTGRAHVETVHRALLRARTAGTLPPDAEPTVIAALARLDAVADDRYDALSVLREAQALVATIGDGSWPRELCLRHLSDAERAFAMLGRTPPSARPRLTAQQGEPVSRPIERAFVIQTGVEPARFGATAVAPQGFSKNTLPPYTREGWELERISLLLGEIAIGLAHRSPQLGEAWRQAEFPERRLLAAMDALFSLDLSLLPVAVRDFGSLPTLDPWMLGALTLVGATLTGRDVLTLAETLELRNASEPEVRSAFVNALVLAPSEEVGWLGRELASSNDAPERALGIEVLVRRGELSAEDLARFSEDELVVAQHTWVALALLDPPSLAQEALDSAERRYPEVARHEDWLVAVALSNHPYATSTIERALEAGFEKAATLLAIHGQSRESAELYRRTLEMPKPHLVDALGWAGDTRALPLLLSLLDLDDDALRNAAAGALERITGAGLREVVEIAPEALLDETARPASDAEVAGSPDTLELPSRSRSAWESWLDPRLAQFPHGVRIRRGVPYSPLVSWTELDRFPCTPAERRWLYRETLLRSGLRFHFDETAFVPAQERALTRYRPIIEASSGAAGSFERPLSRRSFPRDPTAS